ISSTYQLGRPPLLVPPSPGAAGKEGDADSALLARPLPPALPAAVPVLQGGKAVVELGGKAREACSGGGGRFVIFRLEPGDKLAVFDLNEARIARTFAIPAGGLYA